MEMCLSVSIPGCCCFGTNIKDKGNSLVSVTRSREQSWVLLFLLQAVNDGFQGVQEKLKESSKESYCFGLSSRTSPRERTPERLFSACSVEFFRLGMGTARIALQWKSMNAESASARPVDLTPHLSTLAHCLARTWPAKLLLIDCSNSLGMLCCSTPLRPVSRMSSLAST